MSKNPYQELPTQAFWRSAIAERNATDIESVWQPKFKITADSKVVTFGSCFAQHISKALKANQCHWFDGEPIPKSIHHEVQKDFNYGVFSARTGNIYTTSLLHQWLRWALTEESPPNEIWQDNEGVRDPFRPAIEPVAFANQDELTQSRQHTLKALRACVTEADVFIFTLGLTESWFHRDGYEYPLCPGTAAGVFDSSQHRFVNQSYPEVFAQLEQAISLMRQHNPRLQFLLTVSPVPLVATNSGQHVLAATTYSKSVLRAVAGALAERHCDIDYFPSYELISTPPFTGRFYADNKRAVTPAGVKFVMQTFLQATGLVAPGQNTNKPNKKKTHKSAADSVCEEEILATFGATK